MLYLILASIIWAFSFGLIKHNLIIPGLDSNFVAFIRLALSFCVFIPFLRLKHLKTRLVLDLMGTGAIQYGLMYLSYMYSYHFLAAHQVALFTIFTPIFVTLVNDIFRKKFHSIFLVTALFSVLGTGIIITSDLNIEVTLTGIMILQFSNLCFAYGQVRYKIIMGPRLKTPGAKDQNQDKLKDRDVFALLYLGAVIVSVIPSLITTDWSSLQVTNAQVYTLLYLGIIPSGICFFLWNLGARNTNAGTLAVLHNAKIPLAIVFSLIIWNEIANIPKLVIGGLIIFIAVLIN